MDFNTLYHDPRVIDFGLPTPAFLRKREPEPIDLDRDLPTDLLMRFAYIPFVVFEVAWDYADSLINLAIIARRHETKKLCRAIRELRRRYQQFRSEFLDSQHLNSEERNMIYMQEIFSDFFGKVYYSFKNHCFKQYPNLDEENSQLVVTACMGQAVIHALKCYVKIVTAQVEEALHRKITNSILPPHVTPLCDLMGEFAGDCPLGGDAYMKEQEQVTKTLCNYLLKLELTLTLEDDTK